MFRDTTTNDYLQVPTMPTTMRMIPGLLVMLVAASTVLAKDEPKPANSDAPLAEGFPNATKPGTIEVKKYPAYRSAIAQTKGRSSSSSDVLFFTLFGHIQRNKIEMTAPVISTVRTPKMLDTPETKGAITMEFVYRSRAEGKAGADGRAVEVVDHPAQEFLCLGYQGGSISDHQMREAVASLHAWLDRQAKWVEDGPPRRLGYHGPMTPPAQRLWEIQIPVKAAK